MWRSVWGSIVDDVEHGRLNIDQIQTKQAEKELLPAESKVAASRLWARSGSSAHRSIRPMRRSQRSRRFH